MKLFYMCKLHQYIISISFKKTYFILPDTGPALCCSANNGIKVWLTKTNFMLLTVRKCLEHIFFKFKYR